MSATTKRVVGTKKRATRRSRAVVAAERILGEIHGVRGQKVMLAADLAELFPGDSMFQLTTARRLL